MAAYAFNPDTWEAEVGGSSQTSRWTRMNAESEKTQKWATGLQQVLHLISLDRHAIRHCLSLTGAKEQSQALDF